jgi:hypothetical protein
MTDLAFHFRQAGIDLKIRAPDSGVHLRLGNCESLGLQNAPKILIDRGDHLDGHAGGRILRIRE